MKPSLRKVHLLRLSTVNFNLAGGNHLHEGDQGLKIDQSDTFLYKDFAKI